MNLDRFLAIVKKYTEIEKRVQQVEISYNCVGVIELPDTNETDSKTA